MTVAQLARCCQPDCLACQFHGMVRMTNRLMTGSRAIKRLSRLLILLLLVRCAASSQPTHVRERSHLTRCHVRGAASAAAAAQQRCPFCLLIVDPPILRADRGLGCMDDRDPLEPNGLPERVLQAITCVALGTPASLLEALRHPSCSARPDSHRFPRAAHPAQLIVDCRGCSCECRPQTCGGGC